MEQKEGSAGQGGADDELATVSSSKAPGAIRDTPAQRAMAACAARCKTTAARAISLNDQVRKIASAIGAELVTVNDKPEGVVRCSSCGMDIRIGVIDGVISVFTRGPRSMRCEATSEIQRCVKALLHGGGA